MRLRSYNRKAAVRYAHQWAYRRNPEFYDFSALGGDCTNFASQCVYAGSQRMNFTPTYGWYYIDANNKAPAWTGVDYFYNFMTRPDESVGPIAEETAIDRILPGDVRLRPDPHGPVPCRRRAAAARPGDPGRRLALSGRRRTQHPGKSRLPVPQDRPPQRTAPECGQAADLSGYFRRRGPSVHPSAPQIHPHRPGPYQRQGRSEPKQYHAAFAAGKRRLNRLWKPLKTTMPVW